VRRRIRKSPRKHRQPRHPENPSARLPSELCGPQSHPPRAGRLDLRKRAAFLARGVHSFNNPELRTEFDGRPKTTGSCAALGRSPIVSPRGVEAPDTLESENGGGYLITNVQVIRTVQPFLGRMTGTRTFEFVALIAESSFGRGNSRRKAVSAKADFAPAALSAASSSRRRAPLAPVAPQRRDQLRCVAVVHIVTFHRWTIPAPVSVASEPSHANYCISRRPDRPKHDTRPRIDHDGARPPSIPATRGFPSGANASENPHVERGRFRQQASRGHNPGGYFWSGDTCRRSWFGDARTKLFLRSIACVSSPWAPR
jgi:hypothetical protein